MVLRTGTLQYLEGSQVARESVLLQRGLEYALSLAARGSWLLLRVGGTWYYQQRHGIYFTFSSQSPTNRGNRATMNLLQSMESMGDTQLLIAQRLQPLKWQLWPAGISFKVSMPIYPSSTARLSRRLSTCSLSHMVDIVSYELACTGLNGAN